MAPWGWRDKARGSAPAQGWEGNRFKAEENQSDTRGQADTPWKPHKPHGLQFGAGAARGIKKSFPLPSRRCVCVCPTDGQAIAVRETAATISPDAGLPDGDRCSLPQDDRCQAGILPLPFNQIPPRTKCFPQASRFLSLASTYPSSFIKPDLSRHRGRLVQWLER